MHWKGNIPSIEHLLSYLNVYFLLFCLLFDLFVHLHVKQVPTVKKASRASIHAWRFPPTSIIGLSAHYRLQKYNVSVSHLFHLQPSRCVWAPECMAASAGMRVFNAMCGMWRWTTLNLGISHLLARGYDEQVGGESSGKFKGGRMWLDVL